jgi:hypothetical protein
VPLTAFLVLPCAPNGKLIDIQPTEQPTFGVNCSIQSSMPGHTKEITSASVNTVSTIIAAANLAVASQTSRGGKKCPFQWEYSDPTDASSVNEFTAGALADADLTEKRIRRIMPLLAAAAAWHLLLEEMLSWVLLCRGLHAKN